LASGIFPSDEFFRVVNEWEAVLASVLYIITYLKMDDLEAIPGPTV
jgi:hypothetical protein